MNDRRPATPFCCFFLAACNIGQSRLTVTLLRSSNIRHIAAVCLIWQVLTSTLPCCESSGVTQRAGNPSARARKGLHSSNALSEAAYKAEMVPAHSHLLFRHPLPLVSPIAPLVGCFRHPRGQAMAAGRDGGRMGVQFQWWARSV